MSRIIVPSRKLWTPPHRQGGYVVLDAYRGGGGGSGYRYWRVFITANNGDPTYTAIGEVELRGSSGGGNLADVPDNMKVSSNYYPFTPNRLIDGSFSSMWITSGASPPHWFKYDFGTPTSIAEIAIEVEDASRAPKDFVIQCSNDNDLWTDVKAYVGVTGWSTRAFRVFSAMP